MNNKKRLGSAFVLCIMATVMISGGTSYKTQAATVADPRQEVINDQIAKQNLENEMTAGKTAEFEYKASKTKVIVTKYIGTSESIKIPEKIAGLPVTEIEEVAFKDNKKVKSIEFSDKVEVIGRDALNGCTSLEKVILPKGLVRIAEGVFNKCSSLKSIDIPESVTSIGYCAFLDCTSLKSLTIPKGVTDIDLQLASGCTSLENVIIPDGVTIMRGLAFEGCINLRTITIPSSVKDIQGAFDGLKHITICGEEGSEAQAHAKLIKIPFVTTKGISVDKQSKNSDYEYIANSSEVELLKYTGKETEVKIPETIDGIKVTSIGDSAFKDNKSITSVSISEGVEVIGKNAFSGCDKLTNVTLPESLIEIRENAFLACKDLKKIVFGEKLHIIKDKAFANCTTLTEINISAELSDIGYDTFDGCTALTAFNVAEGNGALSSKDGVLYCKDGTNLLKCPGGIKATEFIMPKDVVYVAYSAFKDCLNIKSIIISNEKIMVPDMLKILINNTGTDLKEDTQNVDGEEKQVDKTTLNMTVAEIVKVYKAKIVNTSNNENKVVSPAINESSDSTQKETQASKNNATVSKDNTTVSKDNTTVQNDNTIVSDTKQLANTESAVDTSKSSNTFDGSSALSLMSLLTLSGAAIVTSKKNRK